MRRLGPDGEWCSRLEGRCIYGYSLWTVVIRKVPRQRQRINKGAHRRTTGVKKQRLRLKTRFSGQLNRWCCFYCVEEAQVYSLVSAAHRSKGVMGRKDVHVEGRQGAGSCQTTCTHCSSSTDFVDVCPIPIYSTGVRPLVVRRALGTISHHTCLCPIVHAHNLRLLLHLVVGNSSL